MTEFLNNVNIILASGSFWIPLMFGLVFLFNQQKNPAQEQAMQRLTNQLFEVAIQNKGTFYLPYRLHISRENMRLAYPQADQFFQLKQKYDPSEIFNNQFYLHYR